MKKSILALVALTSFCVANEGFGFGRKKMQISELRGVTESQVAKVEGVASVMVRGKAAELVYRMMEWQHQERPDSEALRMIGYGNGAHYQVRGKQVACSKITKTSKAKHHRDDYACAFDVDKNGNILAGKEAFNPQTFDLAKTATGSNVFKGTSGRSLASVSTTALPPPDPSYGKSHAYLVYEAKGRQRQAENALIVFRGSTAKDIMGMLKNGSPGRVANYGESKGRKGNEIACVESTGKEPERCALVISFRDGSVTRSGNPLFR